MFVLFCGILILGSALVQCDQSLSLGLLKDTRANAVFLPYTPEQKISVAEKAAKMFEIYVNRESKIINYGEEYKDIDPVPRIQSIVTRAGGMSDAEFNSEMSELFLSLRDQHTNYNIPGPHSCFFALSGIFFEFVDSKNIVKHPKLSVERFMRFTELLDKYNDQFEQVSKGDLLLKIDGMTFREYFQANKWLAGGANDYGGMRKVNEFLSVRTGLSNILPKEDFVTYELYSMERKSTYNWFSAVNNECYGRASAMYTILSGKKLPPLPVTRHLKAPSDFHAFNPTYMKGRRDFGSVLFPHLIEAVYPNEFASGPILTPTHDPTVSWTVYDRGNGYKLGIIYLKDFMPARFDAVSVLLLIRNLLTNQLKDTDGLVFDVRNNGGGLITMADFIPQLFVKGFRTPGFRALVSQVNRNIFANESAFGPSDPWTLAMEQAGLKDMYTPLVKFETDESANFFGTVYYKPVGVFNNANCYSACDLFSENMQDSGAAIIFGEDGASGAGGANVIEYNDFLAVVDTIDFQPLPFPQDSGFRIGWRQQVRYGKNEGKIIEDIGVIPDHIIRPKISDIVSNSTRSTQFDRIADILNEYGRETGRNEVYFDSEPMFSQQPTEQYVEIPIISSGLDRFNLLNKHGEIIGTKSVKVNGKEKVHFSLESKYLVKKTGAEEFIIQGFRKEEEVVYTHRFIRFVPTMKHYFELSDSTPFSLDLTRDIATMPCLAVYNRGTRVADGWNIEANSQKLRIGNGTLYENNVDSTLSIFIKGDLKGKLVGLSLKGWIDTEPTCDYLYVQYVDADERVETIASYEGTSELDEELVLENLGDTVEVRLVFQSDPFMSMKGVELESIGIRFIQE